MNSALPPLPPAAALPVQGAPAVPVMGPAGSAAPAAAAPVASPAAVPGTAAGTPAPAAAAGTGGAPPVPSAPPSAPASTPPSATAVRWSAEMLQNLRLQAFAQLVAQLARQVQASPNAPAPQWPAHGVSEALGRMLQTLLEQMGAQQGRPLQVLAAQPGSAALMQALAAANPSANPSASASTPVAVPGSAPPAPAAPAPGAAPGAAPVPAAAASALAGPAPAAAMASLAVAVAKASVSDVLLATAAQAARGPVSSTGTAATTGAAAGAGAPAATAAAPASAPALPALQNWWVQQGTLVTPQGERGFMLSLQVPQAWAQAQLAAAQPGIAPAAAQAAAVQAGPLGAPSGALAGVALAATPAAAGPWRLPLDVPLQALASGPVAVVLQPRDEPQLRTSALLLLEFQPLRQAQGQALSSALPFTALPPAMVQEMQQLLQNRGDPWLQMAVAQNAGALPREHRGHQSHLCTTAGCQYEGRAPCAQPFCSEMNRLWGVARAERLR